jgi:hypothetical protein
MDRCKAGTGGMLAGSAAAVRAGAGSGSCTKLVGTLAMTSCAVGDADASGACPGCSTAMGKLSSVSQVPGTPLLRTACSDATDDAVELMSAGSASAGSTAAELAAAGLAAAHSAAAGSAAAAGPACGTGSTASGVGACPAASCQQPSPRSCTKARCTVGVGCGNRASSFSCSSADCAAIVSARTMTEGGSDADCTGDAGCDAASCASPVTHAVA